METVFDAHVDPDLVEGSLAASTLGSMWLDIPRPEYPRLTGSITCDLLVVGAGYTGLWTALRAAQRNPDQRIVLIDARRVGWAASGRNGGFVDASLTHGLENGKSRWPNEIDKLNAMGLENLDGMQDDIEQLGLDVEWQRSGMLSVATEPHQVNWLQEAALGGEGRLLDLREVRDEVHSRTYRRVVPRRNLRNRSPREAGVRTGPRVRRSGRAHLRKHQREVVAVRRRGPARRDTGDAIVTTRRAVLATNVFPSLLRRNRLHTVPVYDYVLATDPLSDAQLDRIGWRARQGIGDCANQFHYYRLSKDNRIVWGGYDAVYHFGGKVNAADEDRPATYRRLAAHFFITFPQLDDVRFSHRWAGAIDTNTRFCAHWGLARGRRVAYANGFTGLGVGAARFAADVCLDLLDDEDTPRTELEMVRKRPCRFCPNRWPASESRRRDGRWIAPITLRDDATSCCERWMRSGSVSIPEAMFRWVIGCSRDV